MSRPLRHLMQHWLLSHCLFSLNPCQRPPKSFIKISGIEKKNQSLVCTWVCKIRWYKYSTQPSLKVTLKDSGEQPSQWGELWTVHWLFPLPGVRWSEHRFTLIINKYEGFYRLVKDLEGNGDKKICGQISHNEHRLKYLCPMWIITKEQSLWRKLFITPVNRMTYTCISVNFFPQPPKCFLSGPMKKRPWWQGWKLRMDLTTWTSLKQDWPG